MKKKVMMAAGIPGVGKTTFLEILEEKFTDAGYQIGLVKEYPYIEEWAGLSESQSLIRLVPNNFDILPEGYRRMNEYVGSKVGLEAQEKFNCGKEIVMFETARGVGEPMVGYADFLHWVVNSLGLDMHELQIANIEIGAEISQVRARMQRRFDESEGTAPIPSILDKYLTLEGTPRCSAVEDLKLNTGDLPIVMNEVVKNGASKEGFITAIEGVYPKIIECISSVGTVEDQLTSLMREKEI